MPIDRDGEYELMAAAQLGDERARASRAKGVSATA
jgi:hypothetical protein